MDTSQYMAGVINDGSTTLFVHCYHGISQSASFVIAYLLYEKHQQFLAGGCEESDILTVNQALKIVQAARPKVNPT